MKDAGCGSEGTIRLLTVGIRNGDCEGGFLLFFFVFDFLIAAAIGRLVLSKVAMMLLVDVHDFGWLMKSMMSKNEQKMVYTE